MPCVSGVAPVTCDLGEATKGAWPEHQLLVTCTVLGNRVGTFLAVSKNQVNYESQWLALDTRSTSDCYSLLYKFLLLGGMLNFYSTYLVCTGNFALEKVDSHTQDVPSILKIFPVAESSIYFYINLN